MTDPEQTLSVARRMGLLLRIVSRVPAVTLRAELGSQFDAVINHGLGGAVRGLALQRSLLQVASAAHDLGSDITLIKGAALTQLGFTTVAARSSCDVDVLVPILHSHAIHHHLIEHHGFRERTPTHPQYHLPVLVDEQGGVVELHTHLPYLQLPGAHMATFEDLRDADHLLKLEPPGLCAFVPRPHLLLAHTLSHGLVQHGHEPEGYPALRMLSDVIDLLSGEPSLDADRSFSLISAYITRETFDAMLTLAAACRAGVLDDIWASQTTPGTLLRHMVYGALDDDYRQGLKLLKAVHRLQVDGPWRMAREYFKTTFHPADADLERIFGSDVTRPPWVQRALRPFNVVARVARIIPSAAKIIKRPLLDRWRRLLGAS